MSEVCLIRKENDKYALTNEARDILKRVSSPISVITVAGPYRSGKSYLLNRLLNRQKGFTVGPSQRAQTKGIYLWGGISEETVEIEGKKTQVNILFLDTEGIGSVEEDSQHDTTILSLALMLADTFIYNTMGFIDEKALDTLSLVVNLCNNIASKNSASSPIPLSEFLPQFIWVLRDHHVKLVDENDRPITSNQYLEEALIEKKTSKQSKNEIRRALKQYFPKRHCVTLVRPTHDDDDLRAIDKLPEEKVRKEFLHGMDNLVKKSRQNLIIKKIFNKQVGGDVFIALIESLLDKINGGAIPSIVGSFESIAYQENSKYTEMALNHFHSNIEKIKLPLEDLELERVLEEITRSTLEQFMQNSLGDKKQSFIDKINKEVVNVKKRLAGINFSESSNLSATIFLEELAKFNDMKYNNINDVILACKKVITNYSKVARGPAKLEIAIKEMISNELFFRPFENFCAKLIQNLESKEKSVKEEFNKLSNEQEILKLKWTTINDETERQKIYIKDLQEDKRRLEDKIEKSYEEIKELSTKLTQEKLSISNHNTELKMLKIEVEREKNTAQQNSQKYEDLKKESQDKIGKLKAELENQKKEHSNQHGELSQSLEKLTKNLKDEIYNATRSKEEANQTIQKLTNTLQVNQQNYQEKEKEFINKLNQFSEDTESHKKKHNELLNEIKKLEQAIKDKDHNLQILKYKEEEQKKQLSSLENNRNDAQDKSLEQVKVFHEKEMRLLNENKSLKENEKLLNENNQKMQEKLNILEKELKDLLKKERDLNNEKFYSQEEEKVVKENLKALQEKEKALASENKELKDRELILNNEKKNQKRVSAEEIRILKEKVNSLQGLTSENKELKEKVESLQLLAVNSSGTKEKELINLNNENRELREKLRTLQELNYENKQLKEKIEFLQTLSNEKNAHALSLQTLHNDNKEIKDKVDSLQSLAKDSKASLDPSPIDDTATPLSKPKKKYTRKTTSARKEPREKDTDKDDKKRGKKRKHEEDDKETDSSRKKIKFDHSFTKREIESKTVNELKQLMVQINTPEKLFPKGTPRKDEYVKIVLKQLNMDD